MWGFSSLKKLEKHNNGGKIMGYKKYLRNIWNKKENKEILKERLIQWRTEPVSVRITHPTRPDKASSVGYKAKQGFVLVRQRVKRGGRMTEQVAGGRRSSRAGRNKVVGKSYQTIAEERASKNYPNCEVLNSYYVAKDGKHYWYEVILIDRSHPAILKDKEASRIIKGKRRVQRGLTSSAKKSRGLRKKGQGSEKTRK